MQPFHVSNDVILYWPQHKPMGGTTSELCVTELCVADPWAQFIQFPIQLVVHLSTQYFVSLSRRTLWENCGKPF